MPAWERRRPTREESMDIGYFTLSDNHYENNTPTPTNSSPTLPPRRSMPTSSACTRPGSASIISIRSACSPAPIWCSRISRPTPGTSGSRRPSRCCRCIIRSASPSNGRRSTCSGTGASIRCRPRLRQARVPAVPGRFRRQSGHLRGGLELVRSCGSRTAASRITASTIRSTTCASRRSRCSGPPAYVASFSKPSIELAARLAAG